MACYLGTGLPPSTPISSAIAAHPITASIEDERVQEQRKLLIDIKRVETLSVKDQVQPWALRTAVPQRAPITEKLKTCNATRCRSG